RHLVSGDSRLNLRIADFTRVVAIERVDQVERPSLSGWGHTGRVRDEHNRIALFAELHSLIQRRKKAAAPTGAAAVRLAFAGQQDDKAGEILAFAADPVV